MIVCFSASFKKVKLPLLEALVLKEEDAVLKGLCSEGVAEECVLVQTCNRVEIYSVLKDSVESDPTDGILRIWSANSGLSLDILSRNVEILKGLEALANLFNVAAGLDSMAVGEDQILGQVKRAYARAKKVGSVGRVLDEVFKRAINAGKKVRSKTLINQGSTSISSAAVDLAVKELGGLQSKTALIVGAGEAGSIAAETLRRRGVKSITVTNRTHKTGVQLAQKIAGKAIEFQEIYKAILRANLVIVALAADKPVITANGLREVLAKRRVQRPVLVVDISQPRAVEDSVAELPGVDLRNIDSLKAVVEANLRNRQAEAERARKIMLEELTRFESHQSWITIQPLVDAIFRGVESIRQHELKRALSKMTESDETIMGILDRFSRELMERILQTPIEQLREAALSSDDSLLSATRQLFQIKEVKDLV